MGGTPFEADPTPARDPVSVVLIAFNEANTIEHEIRSIYDEVVVKLPGSELLVAEDGSRDGTPEIIQKLVAELGIVHVGCAQRRGYARALIDGVNACRNPLIFFCDTGLKHSPQEFWRLYEKRNDLDLVVGRKSKRQDQWYRRLLTLGYNQYLRWSFRVPGVHDADSGFRLFNRAVVEQVFHSGLTFTSLVGSEVVLRTIHAGLRYGEVPISYRQRVGESKGMPVGSIFKQVGRVTKDLARLKKEWSRGQRS